LSSQKVKGISKSVKLQELKVYQVDVIISFVLSSTILKLTSHQGIAEKSFKVNQVEV
jgi:hypothetical protein